MATTIGDDQRATVPSAPRLVDVHAATAEARRQEGQGMRRGEAIGSEEASVTVIVALIENGEATESESEETATVAARLVDAVTGTRVCKDQVPLHHESM